MQTVASTAFLNINIGESMTLEAKRKIFEKSKTFIDKDGLTSKQNAQQNCKHCHGTGIVDDGDMFFCVLIMCPYCWRDTK